MFSVISCKTGIPNNVFLPILSLKTVLNTVCKGTALSLFSFSPRCLPRFVVFTVTNCFATVKGTPLATVVLIARVINKVGRLVPLTVYSFDTFIATSLLKISPVCRDLLRELVTSRSDGHGKGGCLFCLPIETRDCFSDGRVHSIQ